MERYKILEELGDGTCGCVYKARDWRTNEIVAVKKMKRKFFFWEEYWRLREIKVLRKLYHPNIIKLKEVVRENNEVFLIFEYMNYNLYQIMKEQGRPFLEDEIRSFMSQLLHGLSHLHKSGYFHRDLKPDMWAAGAILAELYTLSPIFPGESEIDQFFKICCVLGTPDLTVFPEGTNASRLYSFINYEKILPANLSDIIPNASPEAIDLISQLCSWDPSRRPTADESLQHPFFQVGWIPHSLPDSLDLKLSNMGANPTLELKLSDFGAEPEDCFLGLTLAVKPSVPDFNMGHDAPHHMKEDALFCSGLEDCSARSVFWSLMPPDQGGICAPVDPSFSLSFSSIQHPTVRVPQSAGYSIPSLQPNILDGRFLTVSPPFPQSHCL
ncbi:hypothetical protein C1H46_026568 [Malus baccata]|uniref:Protein kinase domain-containing protein n=1 Tax=Malus baccata TaxID=106549 RepID=A0A540LMZ9_MALBA|nr:hypothetical protein C1H46_026568 [Malus baccata]